jgi:hypothetical protein
MTVSRGNNSEKRKNEKDDRKQKISKGAINVYRQNKQDENI